MTDQSDTALLPCPFCGESRASTYHVRDGRVAMCPACGAKSGSQFNGPSDIPSADQRAIAAWNRRAPDAARQEGIALGLAMAARMIQTCDCKQYCKLGEACPLDVRRDIQEKAPIQPHVAAARVLLEQDGPGIFGMFQDRALPASWNEIDQLADAWLEQIAGGK